MKKVGLLLIPLSPLALVAPAYAVTYLTVEQAQTLMFEGSVLTRDTRELTAAQMQAIESDSGVKVMNPQVNAWHDSAGGWFLLDQVIGKHEFINYAVALDTTGAVRQLEILDYHESYGGEVHLPAWRRQFIGKHHGSPLQLNSDIKNISGATLSCGHVTDGVRRLLATYALVLASTEH
jgi:Na+-translocating ferredoxin:NAD+ oxidoreductase RnfG subunit